MNRISRTIASLLLAAAAVVPAPPAAEAGEAAALSVLFPKDRSIVSGRVNVVLDPASDWSAIPWFQVVANAKELEPVGTSTGRHAFEGVPLAPGMNRITVRALAPKGDGKKKELTVIATREIQVFSVERPVFRRQTIPEAFQRLPFHTGEQEAECSGCHRLETEARDRKAVKPDEVMCFSCHRKVVTGRYLHGPVAVWKCLACHSAESAPARDQCKVADPWKFSKKSGPLEPDVFTIPNEAVFKEGGASFEGSTKAVKKQFAAVLAALKENRGYRLRVEVHNDDAPIRTKQYRSAKALTDARAWALAGLLVKYGVPRKQITAAGMGSALPKAPNDTDEGRRLNNRIEVVLFPPDAEVTDSGHLPKLRDRIRIVIELSYAKGPAVKGLKIMESVPAGLTYVAGSSSVTGVKQNPHIKRGELAWDLGNRGSTFSDTITYVLRRTGKTATETEAAPETSVTYVLKDRELRRVFDARQAGKEAPTIYDTCMRCHGDVLAGERRHGPTEAGYCTLCHDPHGSAEYAMLRKPSWDLCVTCHGDMASGRHIVAGFVRSDSHPTKDVRDPLQPGKRLSCASCHDPHSAGTWALFSYGAKNKAALCGLCHQRMGL